MSIHPSASFPLRASDQADVIRLFLELMSQADRVERAAAFPGNRPAGSSGGSNHPEFPDQRTDLE